jgi:hypothetical protein
MQKKTSIVSFIIFKFNIDFYFVRFEDYFWERMNFWTRFEIVAIFDDNVFCFT